MFCCIGACFEKTKFTEFKWRLFYDAYILALIAYHASLFICNQLTCCILAAYVGPYEHESPDSLVTKIQVLNVTPDSTKTEETDSDDDIPTIDTGSLDLL